MKFDRKNAIKILLLSMLVLSLVACATKVGKYLPDWIENPKRNQAVGSCATHALGIYKQKECAVTRARLELAARKGIEIKSTSLMTESASNAGSSSTLNQQIIQEVSTKIKSRLVDSFHDKEQDIYWVLVEEN